MLRFILWTEELVTQLCLTLCDPMDCSPQASLSMRFSRQYSNELPCPPPEELPDPVIKSTSLMSPALAGGFFTTSTTWEAYMYVCVCVCVCTYIYISSPIYLLMDTSWLLPYLGNCKLWFSEYWEVCIFLS